MNLIKFKIVDSSVSSREGIKDGVKWKRSTQKAKFFYGDDEARAMELPVKEGEQPYPPGEYTLSAEAYTVGGDYGEIRINMRNLKLIPYPNVAVVQERPHLVQSGPVDAPKVAAKA